MIRPISAIRNIFRGRRAEAGDTVISFAFLLPVLLALTLGILEFSLVVVDYTRASEATRRAARVAATQDPIGNLDNVDTNNIVCTGSTGSVSCSGGAVLTAATFDNIVQSMQNILPTIGRTNVQVVYSDSGVGAVESGGIKPVVTVNLINLTKPFLFLDALGFVPPEITFPPFSTTQMVAGYTP